ncbi:PDZ domain-containing protein [Spongiivirga sp. MCCC 1A20706]|uniref:S41 family peptidase n=1 Tax=Spongiivirga sp. MCCC 1A20706 TaxID=3160963 RepID=UPI003977E272
MKQLITGLLCLSFSVSTAQGTQLLRQPTISNTHIVFVYANDLWKVPIAGGDAVRLTSDEGYESVPHFSPDGKLVAFTGQYDGNTDVYVVPLEGGSPKRLTWHPFGDYVTGWTPDGKVLFRSARKAHPTQINKLYAVSTEGGFPEEIDIPRASYGELSDDGSHLAYTPITSWDAEWRNYRGGQAMPIWIVDMKTKELTTTSQKDQERHLDPVWVGKKIFHLSERDYASNIWSFDTETGQEKQHTFHKKFDIKSLDAFGNSIVYEQGGYLHILNANDNSTRQLEINVKGDQDFSRVRWENVNGRSLANPNISPTGKRAIFEHRGEIFTVPKENGSWRNLTNSSGVADRYPIWSPKGDRIAWFSDNSGEYQLVIADQQGAVKKEIELPANTFYFVPDWSPDGKHIAYSDTDYNVWITTISTGKSVKVATDRYAHPNRTMNPVWSPDSKWIAYPKQLDSHFKAIFAYNVSSKQTVQITDGMADAISPVWDEKGKYLYFLASTDYGLNSGWLDMSSYDPQVNRSLYCAVLSNKDKAPIMPKSDEETALKNTAEKDSSKKKKSKKKSDKKEDEKSSDAITVTIDSGVQNRIVALKLDARNYLGLIAGSEKKLFVFEAVPNEQGASIHSYDVEKQKKEDYESGVRNAVISANRKSLLIQKGGNWMISATSGKPNASKDGINTNLKVKVDPKAEYHQIFKEGWRFMRDFLYVDNVHGAPWDDVYKWYAPWIDHVRHRTDLNYVVDIMSGEVAIGHSYVYGGDFVDLDFVPIGLLGCDLVLENGGYKIDKIYTGESWNPQNNAPLAIPGINVKEGEYLVAVNGKELLPNSNPYAAFEQTAGRATTIMVNSKPGLAGAREVLVTPVQNENGLRTSAWIEGNRKKVDELSGGKLAYVYVPNTGGGGFTSFNRYYFSQQDKKGVIIDERNNGGGSAADYMIDIMNRKLFGYFNSKAGDNRPWTTPIAGIWGPKVMLINERAGSGGDLLPYMFKEAKIGTLVGTRTWGGLVGTWDTPPFIDGGRMVAPRGGFFDADGEWAVEGEGVAPDIEVIQNPKQVLQGKDPQLEAGVKEAMRLLRQGEFQLKPEPAAPIRSKRPAGFKK